jgi:hypothetical protein
MGASGSKPGAHKRKASEADFTIFQGGLTTDAFSMTPIGHHVCFCCSFFFYFFLLCETMF